MKFFKIPYIKPGYGNSQEVKGLQATDSDNDAAYIRSGDGREAFITEEALQLLQELFLVEEADVKGLNSQQLKPFDLEDFQSLMKSFEDLARGVRS